MWLTRLSITRPVTILMLVLTLVILGWQSRNRLPVDLYPDVQLPMLFISTVYPGTGPEEMETLVSKPIEDQLSTISGLKKLSSTSAEGVSQVVMEFELGTDINEASADVRSKLDALRNALPQDAKAPVVMKLDFGAAPVITLNVASNRISSIEVRRLADDVLKDRLSQASGVASVSVSGGDVREVRVEVEKSRLEAYNLSINQVVSALQSENLNLPSGTVEEAHRNYAVRVIGEFSSPEQINDIRIPNAAGNPDLRIGDIARVTDTVAEPSVYSRLNGGSSVMLTIQKQSDGNTVKVVDNVKAELEKLTGKPFTEAHLAQARKGTYKANTGFAPEIPEYITITTSSDQSIFINEALQEVNKSLFEGALLAVLIVFLFLHSLRGTVIVALAIPTSMIATFMVMNLLGFSMNMMSMLGLSLSVGILVDDSIVVLENIHRHLKMGKSPSEAAIAGRSEIGLAAMAITLVDVVVFVPIAFIGGIMGQFFRQFGIVVATATLFSLFVSFTLTPMLASRWLKSHDKEEEEEEHERLHPGLFRRFTNAWDRGYGKIYQLYRGMLAWSLDHHAAAICIGLMVLVASVGSAVQKPDFSDPKTMIPLLKVIGGMGILALLGMAFSRPRRNQKKIHTGAAVKPLLTLFVVLTAIDVVLPTKFAVSFFPQVDQRQIVINIEQAVGTPLAVTDATTRKIERALHDAKRFPEVQQVTTMVGGTSGQMGIGGSTASDTAQIKVELKDMAAGLRTTDAVITQINKDYKDEPGVKITASAESGGGPGGDPISIDVSGADTNRTKVVANQIADIVRKTTGAYAVDLSWRDGRPELQASIDRDRAAQYGLSVAQIAAALRTSMEGDTTSKYREDGKEYDIRVSLPKDQRDLLTQVPTMVVGNTPSGQPVYLYEVVRMEQASGPTKIERKNRQRTVTVTGKLTQDANLDTVQTLVNAKVKKLDLQGITVNWSGQAEEMKESFGNMGSAMLLSLILEFILMAALFESIIAPFIVWLTVPQAMAGALFALTITHRPLSIISMIGIIMLVGLVTKNAILLVDYTNTLRREHGMSRRDALLQAGPTRLQPILMTTLAMVFGMLPTAIAWSKGSEMRQPMAIVVIGGLLLAMFLSLLMVPTFYEIIDGIGERYASIKERAIDKVGV